MKRRSLYKTQLQEKPAVANLPMLMISPPSAVAAQQEAVQESLAELTATELSPTCLEEIEQIAQRIEMLSASPDYHDGLSTMKLHKIHVLVDAMLNRLHHQ